MLVTGYGETLRTDVFGKDLIDAVLHKPYSGHELAQAVRRVLDGRDPQPPPSRKDTTIRLRP